ncbi:MAG TPA: transketolase [Ruminococcaceae bacterium]|nr:transketolase [Oscillospiraceae bacterium]
MEKTILKELKKMAARVRMGVIEGVYNAKSGHPGGSLSVADALTYLYFEGMRINPKNPKWDERDRFVLSKGHTAPALYAALANRGYFDTGELKYLRKPGHMLQGHPDKKGTPGVDMSTGSLGQGISAAAGMALSGKLGGKAYRVYAVLGDGEIEEGQVWEAAMFAAHKELDNLCVFVDNNGLQIDGTVEEVNSPYPIGEKFIAFGWRAIEINGNDFEQLDAAFKEAREEKGRPTAIIGKTVKGRGVSFMENQVSWHGTAPNEEQYNKAMEELRAGLDALD